MLNTNTVRLGLVQYSSMSGHMRHQELKAPQHVTDRLPDNEAKGSWAHSWDQQRLHYAKIYRNEVMC